MAAPETLQIFISSPGDVGQERVIAERVIKRLQGEFAGRVQLEPIRWEWEPLRATEHFQEQITPPAETDIALFILWSRLGTPLPEDKFQKESGEPYRSGTEWEFENAVEGYQESGTPDLLTYRKTKDPEATLSDEENVQRRLEQKKALDRFIDQWFRGEEDESFRAAFHTFETPGEFERQLEEHLRRLVKEHLPERFTEAGQVGPKARTQWHRGSPFRGLRAFEAEHAPIFFGRTEETSQIIEALEAKAQEGAPFVLVTGPSGSGKSSVVRAGVVPTLTRPGVAEGIGVWRRSLFRPSDAPENLLEGLARALLAEGALPEVEDLGFGPGEFGELLRETPERAIPLVKKGLEASAEAFAEEKGLPEPPEARLLLTVDQLEEVFTLGEAADEHRRAFTEAVRTLVQSGHVWTVATLRSDFFERCAELPALMALKEGDGHYDLEPPGFAALGYMIRGPVRAAGLQFERDPERKFGLDEVLHEAAAEAPEALPLLEFTLQELYHRRTEEGVLTFEAYEELGGLTGAIAERAEATYESLGEAVQAALPEVLRALVTIEPEGEGKATGRRAPRAEVEETSEQEALVEAFVEARLLVTGRNDAGEPVVGLAHEALLREWPRLEEWIDRNRAFLQTRARVRERAAHWAEEGRPEDLLLPKGQPLAEARGLLDEHGEALGETLRTYVERSVERAERQKRRRRRVVAGVAAAFFLVVAGFGLFSYQQWTAAAEQRDRAQAEAKAATQVSDFLVSLFESSNPFTSEGETLSARDLLRRGQGRVEALEGQPAVQARLLDAMGQAHHGLGNYGPADSLLQRALTLRRRAYGDDHVAVAKTLDHLGDLKKSEYSWNEALAYRRDAASIVRNQEGPLSRSDSLLKANILSGLSGALRNTGQPDSAETLMRRALAIREAVQGADHPAVWSAKGSLAYILRESGSVREAKRLYRDVLAWERENADSLDVASTLNDLGYLLKTQGKFEQAERRYRESLRIKEAHLGPAHPSTLVTRGNNLGTLYEDQDDFAAAEKVLREQLRAVRARYPGDHWRVGKWAQILGETLLFRGQHLAEAEALLREGLRVYKASDVASRNYVLDVQAILGHCLVLRNKDQEAKPLLEEVHAVFSADSVDKPDDLAHAEIGLGIYHMRRGRYAKAESLLTKAHERFGQIYNMPGDTSLKPVRQVESHLIDLYEAWGKPSKAQQYASAESDVSSEE